MAAKEETAAAPVPEEERTEPETVEREAGAGEEPAAEPSTPAATPRKSHGREKKRTAETAVRAAAKKAKGAPKAPNRPTLEPELQRLLAERRLQSSRRPLFVRQQAHRYYAIGRWGTWRRPRGLQSKQRRHYGYRPTVVSVGFGSPRRTRGLTPTGFEPVIVRTPKEIEALVPERQAVVIARTVGTRKRLLLEEVARKRGLHVLNPLLHERGGS